MWENGNNDTGLPTMKVTTQNHLKGLLKPKTVDAGKTLYTEARGTHVHGEERNVPRGSLADTSTCSPKLHMMARLQA